MGQFFDIWSKKVNNPSSFTSIFGGKNTPTVYINGNKVTGVPNYRDIKLHAHDEIVLAYGTPPTVIPSKYAFPEGL